MTSKREETDELFCYNAKYIVPQKSSRQHRNIISKMLVNNIFIALAAQLSNGISVDMDVETTLR